MAPWPNAETRDMAKRKRKTWNRDESNGNIMYGQNPQSAFFLASWQRFFCCFDFMLGHLQIMPLLPYTSSCPENILRLSLVGLVLAKSMASVSLFGQSVWSTPRFKQFTCQTGKLSDNGAVDAVFYYSFLF